VPPPLPVVLDSSACGVIVETLLYVVLRHMQECPAPVLLGGSASRRARTACCALVATCAMALGAFQWLSAHHCRRVVVHTPPHSLAMQPGASGRRSDVVCRLLIVAAAHNHHAHPWRFLLHLCRFVSSTIGHTAEALASLLTSCTPLRFHPNCKVRGLVQCWKHKAAGQPVMVVMAALMQAAHVPLQQTPLASMPVSQFARCDSLKPLRHYPAGWVCTQASPNQ
jgi:hypothetical protein